MIVPSADVAVALPRGSRNNSAIDDAPAKTLGAEGDYDPPLKVKLAGPHAVCDWSPTLTARGTPPSDVEKAGGAAGVMLGGVPDVDALVHASTLSKEQQLRELARRGGSGGAARTLKPSNAAAAAADPHEALERGGTFGLSGSSNSGSSSSSISSMGSGSSSSSGSSTRSRNSVCAAILPRASSTVSDTRSSAAEQAAAPAGGPVDQRPSLPPPNRGRGAEALRAITQAQAALALRATSAWRDPDADTASIVSSRAGSLAPTESTGVSRATATPAASVPADPFQKASAHQLRGMLRSMTSNQRERPAGKGRVGPKKRPLDAQARDGAAIDPAFCCSTPGAAARRSAPWSPSSVARTWDSFPPAKDTFAHVLHDPATPARRKGSPGGAARARGRHTPEAEVKEEGGDTESLTTHAGVRPATAAAAAAAAAAGVAVAAAPAANVALATADADGLNGAAVAQGLVLPCGPSDEEKVLYHSTGRSTMVGFGFIAFSTVFCGMLWFTISSPLFYWYAVPTFFTLVSMCCHYLGVAVWGKDFDREAHEEVGRKCALEGYTPTVDVFLPVCNEPLVLLANTWNHILDLDYPRFAVHVLDDGAKDEVKDLAAEYGFRYIRRENRPELKKAGNLRHAFAQTVGEITAVFDADFCPRPDFLRETLPYFTDPAIGIVQTPQFFRRKEEQTWVEQGAGASQEAFYRMIQMNLDRFNAAVCVGSCALYRREAVEPFGGVAPIEHSEDMYTGYKMTELGYKIKYVPLNLAMGICPDEPRSLFLQQYRWCMGTSTLVLEKGFWQSDISKMHKLCFVNGMFYYLQTALFVFLAPVPVMLLIWIKADDVLWYYFGFLVPGLIFTIIIIPMWSRQDSITTTMAVQRVKIIQSYAHLYAIKDRLMGTVASWVPSGGGASKSSSSAYESAVRVLVIWNVVSTTLIVGGSIWRVTVFPWYHFVIPTALALCSCAVSLSTLWL